MKKVKYDFTMFMPSFKQSYSVFKVKFKYCGFKKCGSIIKCYFLAQSNQYAKWKNSAKELRFNFVNLPIFDSAAFELRDKENNLVKRYDKSSIINIDFMVEKKLRFEDFILNNADGNIYFTIDFNCERLDLDNDLLFFMYFMQNTKFSNYVPRPTRYKYNETTWKELQVGFGRTLFDLMDRKQRAALQADEYEKICSRMIKWDQKPRTMFMYMIGHLQMQNILLEDDIKEVERRKKEIEEIKEQVDLAKVDENWSSLYPEREEIYATLNLIEWLDFCIQYPENAISGGLHIADHFRRILYKGHYYYLPIENNTPIEVKKDFLYYDSYEEYHNRIVEQVNDHIDELLSDCAFGYKYALMNRLYCDIIFRKEDISLQQNMKALITGEIWEQEEYENRDIDYIQYFEWPLLRDDYGLVSREKNWLLEDKEKYFSFVSKSPEYTIPICEIVERHFNQLPFVSGYEEVRF